MKVSILGPKGTFVDIALSLYLQKNNLFLEKNYFSSIDESIKALDDSSFSYSLIPLENSLDGYVQRSLDLLLEDNLNILDEITLPIHYKLVSSCPIEQIKKIYVQFKAHGQCLKLLSSFKDVEIIQTQSNTLSFELFKKDEYLSSAIVPIHLDVDKYQVIKENVEDFKENFTRFVLVSKTDSFSKSSLSNEIKASISICPNNDRSGMLFDILKEFKDKDLNLCSIVSRPTKKMLGTYNFFIEISSNIDKLEDIFQVIATLNKEYDVRLLGIVNK